MKKILLSTLLAATSILGVNAHAATATSSMDVNATVNVVCYFKTLRDVHFDYNPTATSDLTQSFTSNQLFSYQCTNKAAPLIHVAGANNPNRILTGADNHTLNYKLEFDDDSGNLLNIRGDESVIDGSGLSVLASGGSFNFNFTIPKGQFVKGQNYSETITLTLSY